MNGPSATQTVSRDIRSSAFRVKTRIQAAEEKGRGDDVKAPTVLQLLRKILRDEGFLGYYKGFGASMLNTFSMRKYSGVTYPSLYQLMLIFDWYW